MNPYKKLLFFLVIGLGAMTATVEGAAMSSVSSSSSSASSSRTISAENTQKMWSHLIEIKRSSLKCEYHYQELENLAKQGLLASNDCYEYEVKIWQLTFVARGSRPLECIIGSSSGGLYRTFAKLVILLLNNGADLGLQAFPQYNDQRHTLFHFAASTSANTETPSVMQELITRRPDLLDAQDSQQRTPLMYAAGARCGENHNSYDRSNHWQCEKIKILINNDADIHILDCYGKKALDYFRPQFEMDKSLQNIVATLQERAQQRFDALKTCPALSTTLIDPIIAIIALYDTGLGYKKQLKQEIYAHCNLSYKPVIADLVYDYALEREMI